MDEYHLLLFFQSMTDVAVLVVLNFCVDYGLPIDNLSG